MNSTNRPNTSFERTRSTSSAKPIRRRARRSTQSLDGIEMTSGLLVDLAYFAAVIIIPAAALSLLAFFCAKERKTRLFACSLLLLSCTASVVVLVAMRWWNPYSGDPLTWRDAPGAFLSWAPVFVLPGAFLWRSVKGTASRRWIPALAILGVILALPVGFILGALVG